MCSLTFQKNGSREVSACRFAPDGKTLVSASWDKTLKIWDVESGTCKTTLEGHSGMVFACDFAPHGKTIVSASEDKTVRIWDVESGKCQRTLKGHRYLCLFCAIAVGNS